MLLVLVEGGNIPVMMGIDDSYVRVAVVALTSMFDNAKPSTFYHVTILIPGNFGYESKVTMNALEAKYDNCRIDFLGMGEKYKNAPRRPLNAATFYRLDAPSLFPNLKKCLFLDGDIIVRHDLTEMFNVNIDDFYLAGVFEGNTQPNAEKKIKLLGMPDLKQYINTGVVVMNLEKLRIDQMEERYSRFIEEKGRYIKTQSFLFGEQDVINPVCYGKILHLPLEYGLLINLRKFYKGDFEKKDPIIVHFAGGGKPWESRSFGTTVFHIEFWYYAEKTGLLSKKRDYSRSEQKKSKKDKMKRKGKKLKRGKK